MPRRPAALPAADSAVVGLLLFAVGLLMGDERTGYGLAVAGALLAVMGIVGTYRRKG